MTKKTALTLSGSLRKGSYNCILQDHVGAQLEQAGVAVNAISLADYDLPLFHPDDEAESTPRNAGALAEQLRSHDIVFITTPEYNGSMSPVLVNTITWLSRQKPSPFRHAVFGIGGVSTGKYGAIMALGHLRDSLTKLGTLVVPTLLGVGPASAAFDVSGVPSEPAIQRKIEQIVVEMTQFSRG
ncbi:FMN reductase [Devosia pacifica]|uniref:FMN reductase n=1 Tax=Devosia pacifica TaxID=1335967 RepID=A0A918S4Q9_9HYPH|nr:NADPH-dependent FMN reductase [Devosia pacifica]GHA23130.1 FMN reductase [Devosia pacifica]